MSEIALRSAHATQSALTAALSALHHPERGPAGLDLMLAFVVMKIATESADERLKVVSDPHAGPAPLPSGARALRVPGTARFDLLARAPLKGKAVRAMEALRALVDANPQVLSGTLNLEALYTPPPTDREIDALLARLRIPALDFRAMLGTDRPDLDEAVDALRLGAGHRRMRAERVRASACLTRLMLSLVNPAPNESIYDPLCQQGDLLVAAGRWVRSEYDAPAKRLLGDDPLDVNARTARLRLLLQNDDPRAVQTRTSLEVLAPRMALREEDRRLDDVEVALCRPPLTLTWRNDGAGHDALERFGFGIAPRRRAHLALIQHMRARLDRQHGRMAIVVPQGVLFRRGEEAEIRTALLERNEIETVIALPDRFATGSSVGCALLVLRKRRRDTSVLFVDGQSLPPPTPTGAWLDAVTVDRLLDICHARQCVPGIAARVPGDQVIASESCLSVSRHIPVAPDKASFADVAALRSERRTLTEELRAMQDRLDGEIDALTSALQSEQQVSCDIAGLNPHSCTARDR